MIRKELLKQYWQMLIPALVLLLVAKWAIDYRIIIVKQFAGFRVFEVSVFVLAVGFSLAFPVLYRMLFINKIKDRKYLPASVFLQYQKNSLLLVMVSPYLAVISALFRFSSFYFFAVILFALYGCYYYFPSQKKIDFEKRMFRVQEN